MNALAFFQQNGGAVTAAGALMGFGYLASKNEAKVTVVAAENKALAAENDKKVAVLAAENKALAAESERKLMEKILDLAFSYEYKSFVKTRMQEKQLRAEAADAIEADSK
mmetsp:Transcript_47750/g.112693  ORF Transcript_47750/g.112693 Transcript_47750/m.112693 type:complete len:110 (+) Transcript_47750:135-464(+)